MALGDLKPDIVSGQLLARLNDNSVFAQVANTDYQGEIRSFGQSVKIVQPGPVTIRSYTPGTTAELTVEQVDVAGQTLHINQADYYAFEVEDADNAQARAQVLSQQIVQAAWGLRDTVDAYIAGLYGDAAVAVGGTSATGVDITSTNVIKYLMEAFSKLSETNTPKQGRWAVMPPWLINKAVMAGIVQKTDNNAMFENGMIGKAFGFDLYESNNVTGLSGTNRFPVLFGYRGSIAMATQVLTSEIVRPSKQFVTLAKGLLVFGAKVTRPNNLGVLFADYTAEAT